MIGRKDVLVAAFAAIVMLSGTLLAGTVGVAQAALISEEEHWKYKVDKFLWDDDRRRTYGLITPQIVIQNETADRLEGYIADASGTRLDMYDGEQIVFVRFLSNSTGASGWEMADRVRDGYFAIDIAPQNREAELVRIHIGTNQYTVDNGTPTTAQLIVNINAGITNYRMNSTLDQVVTEVAQAEEEPKPVRSVYEGGSLIDWILRNNGMLPVRSSDSGE